MEKGKQSGHWTALLAEGGGDPDGGGRARREAGLTTRAVHGHMPVVPNTPLSQPLFQTSAWRVGSIDDFHDVLRGDLQGYVYSRGYGNPTVEALERTICHLEHAEAAVAFNAGVAAIHSVLLDVVPPGGRVIASRELYGGTLGLLDTQLQAAGVSVTYVDPAATDAIVAELPGASLCLLETISNPFLTVADLSTVGAACAAAGVPLAVDNTFASPVLCNPADFGATYVMHSASKYIGGHSDVIGGIVCASAAHCVRLRKVATSLGNMMQPFEAWLCLRALPTLDLRVRRQCQTAGVLAALLERCPSVENLRYPGRPTDGSHAVACAHLRDFGGVLSFELRGGRREAVAFCEALRLVWIAGSLGGPHSVVCVPAESSHLQVSARSSHPGKVSDRLVRVAVGLEDSDDLVADFKQALQASAEC